MQRIPLAQSDAPVAADRFWAAVMVHHDKPHVANRKMAAAAPVLFYEIRTEIDDLKVAIHREGVLYEARKLKNPSKATITLQLLKNLIDAYDKTAEYIESDAERFRISRAGVFVSVRLVYSRRDVGGSCVEAVLLNKRSGVATFVSGAEPHVPVLPPFSYDIELDVHGYMRVSVDSFEHADTAAASWLADKLFPSILKWSTEDQRPPAVASLQLVDVGDFCETYASLKRKHGEDLVAKWPTKAGTDPQKYVYEDIAIAAYLICVWRRRRPEDVISFVDLGCGNGLLVHVLNAEGYRGRGVDLRRRDTWQLYPPTVDLREEAVHPGSAYPGATWIIGNHSDELTPWIPVMALRSGPDTNYFVLPCCAYEFSGRKFSRRNTAVSQYQDYMGYVRDVGRKCGFDTKMDRLRIPSTKRTCFVGIQRTTTQDQRTHLLEEVEAFVSEALNKDAFRPRVEPTVPRNCTALDKDLIHSLVAKCASLLLQSGEDWIRKADGSSWNKGADGVSLSELIKALSGEERRALKSECGGLQTLLRNHRYIFEFVSSGVRLRGPLRRSEDTERYSGKPCWWYSHHPDGCLYEGDVCAYTHPE